MKIEAPIFIVGIGRCGSTIFYDVLSEHENAAWLSDICSKYPKKPELNNLLLKLVDYPIFKKIIRHRFQPSECYSFWENAAKGFSTPFRDLLDTDLTNNNSKSIKQALEKIPTKKRNKLLVKLTGWPRIGYISKIFPDAKFIHVIRDGRAVVNSMVHVDFWWGWRGPWNWRWGQLTEEQNAEWERHDKSFLALGAIEWKIIMDAFEDAKQKIKPKNYLEVKYEDFCENTKEMMKIACDFGGIEYSNKFENNISKYKIRNSNDKWQRDLSSDQQKIVNDVLKEYLQKYDYNL